MELSFLDDLKLPSLKECFIKHGIDITNDFELQEPELQELVSRIGERLKIKKFIKSKQPINNLETITLKSDEPSLESTLSTASTIILEPEETIALLQNTLQTPEKVKSPRSIHYDTSASCSKRLKDDVNIHGSNHTNDLKLVIKDSFSLSDSSSELFVKDEELIPDDQDLIPVEFKFSNGNSLETYLQSSSIGLTLMASYELNKNLKPNMRQRLVSMIIAKLMDEQESVKCQTLELIAEAIVKLFMTESKACYYIKASKKKTASGKLTDKYRNERKFQALGRKAKKSQENTVILENKCTVSYDISNKIAWLHHSCEPWTDVVKIWTETSKERLNQRQEVGPAMDIVNRWPALKNVLGYTLVRIFLLKFYYKWRYFLSLS